MRFKALIFLLLTTSMAFGQEKNGAWSDQSESFKQWLNTQKQPGSQNSCCGLGDAINVDILDDTPSGVRVKVTNPRATNAPIGFEFIIPHDRIVAENYTEDGAAIAWIYYNKSYPEGMQIYCLSMAPKV
jgi:hypothetical protein